MEFPAVSQSRKEFWSEPQYTRSGMLLFTVAFGFFGLHHLMLRSPQTAFLMFIANCFLFGYPWLYDIVQLLPESWGGHGVEKLNTFGMGHAGGALGLGQGMWLPEEFKNDQKGESKDAPPNPLWFVFYCLTLPFTFLAPFFGGDNWGALGKLAYNIIPFGWFLTMCAFAYDLYYLLLKPADLFVFGLKRFFPWTILGMDKDTHSPSITGVRPTISDTCPPSDNFFVGTLKFFLRLALPVLYFINPAFAMSLETGISSAAAGAGVIGNVADAVAGTAKSLGEAAITTSGVLADTATHVLEDGSKIAKTVGTLAGEFNTLGAVKLAAPASLTLMTGGGQISFSALDYATFGSLIAVIGGGFLLAAGRSYGGGVPKGDTGDSPPNA